MPTSPAVAPSATPGTRTQAPRGPLKTDAMRQIDFWAGVPLCALSSILLRLMRLFRRERADMPRNVLLIELSEMGSAILVDPAMQDLKSRGANLHFAIFRHNKPSLDLLGTVPDDNIFCIRANGLVPLAIDTLRFLLWTRAKKIDTVLDLELFSRFTALLSGWSGAARIVGYHRFHNEGLYRGEMLTERVLYNPHVHITRNFLSLVHAAYASERDIPQAKIRSPDSALALKRASVSDEALARIGSELKARANWTGREPLVLLNCNVSELLPQRSWPRERFIALARRILAHRADALVILTGAPGESAALNAVAAEIGDARCVNFAAAGLPLIDLLPLYHLSLVMVTSDSGPGHFAAVTRMPTIVMFGPETPALYGSLGRTETVFAGLHCSPCVSAWNHRKTECNDPKCMAAIGVDDIFARVRHHLDAVPQGRSLPVGE